MALSVKEQAQANMRAALANPNSGISLSNVPKTSATSSNSSSNSSYSTPSSTSSSSSQGAIPRDLSAISGMGTMYKNLPGTSYYSTNPGNVHAAYYNADGTPVAHVGYASYDGTNFDGFTSNDNFNNIIGNKDATKQYDYIKQLAGSGQIQSFGSIPSMSKDPLYGLKGGTPNSYLTNTAPQGMSASTASAGASASKGAIPSVVPTLNAAKGVIPPALGYGGADYSKLDAAGRAAMLANGAYAKTDAGRAAEIERALSVVKEREAAGLDTKAQYDYLNKLGYVPESVREDTVTPTVEIPTMIPDAVTNVRDSSELQSQAGDSLAIERAALKNAIDTQMASLRNNFNYANQNMNDQRALEDNKMSRTLNPFNGRSGYLQAQVARGRQIDDTYRNGDMNNQLNSLSNEIANFDKLAPERQRQIYNELLQLERNFALNQSQATGQYGGQQTMAARQMELDQAQREWENRFNYGQATGTFSNGQQTLQKAAQEWNQNFQSAQFDWQKAQQAWENAFQTKSFEQDMKDAAASRGLQWASLSQRDKEFIADQAFREKQYNLDVAKYESSLNQPGKYDGEAELITGLDSYKTPTEAKNFLLGEKSNLIQKFGKSYYDSIYKEYVTDKGA